MPLCDTIIEPWGRSKPKSQVAEHFLYHCGLVDDGNHPHLVGIPAVIADHLRAFVGDVLGDGGQKIGGGEHFEVAVDLRVESGAP